MKHKTSRLDKINYDGIGEIVARSYARATESRIIPIAVDRILGMHGTELPSRTLGRIDMGAGATITFRAGGAAREGWGYARARDYSLRLSIRKHGVTGKPVGRPPGSGRVAKARRAPNGTALHNHLLWGKVKKSRPDGISEPTWEIVGLRYGLGYKTWEIAEQIHSRDEAVRQRLSRAVKVAQEKGINFK